MNYYRIGKKPYFRNHSIKLNLYHNMIRITTLEPLADSLLLLCFDDGTEKLVDMKPFIGDDMLTQPLSDPTYFEKVRIYESGRGICWPNEYDMCPDFLRFYAIDARAAIAS